MEEKEEKRALQLNMISNLLVFVMNLGINFFLTPYLTNRIGTEAYGFVSLANNFVNYATILTVALNSMSNRFVTIALHKGNKEEANKYFVSTFFANIIIVLVLIIPSILCIAYLEKMLDIPENLILDVKLLFSLIFFNFYVSIIDSTYSIATFATNKLYLHSVKNMEGNLIKIAILIITCSLLVPHVFYIGIATLVCSIFILIADIIYTKKLLSFVKIKKIYFSMKKVIELIKAGIWNTITKLGNVLTDGLDLIICNLMIDALSMGRLAIAKTIGNVVSTLVSTISNVFQPQLTISYAKGDKKSLLEELKLSMKVTGIFSNIPLCFIFAFGAAFYSLWTPGEDPQLLNTLTIFTVLGFIVSGIINPLYYIYTVTNKIKVDAICRVILGGISTIVVYIILKTTSLGVYAVAAVSTIILGIFNLTFVPTYTAKTCLELKWYAFYPLIFKYMIATAIIAVILCIIKSIFIVNSWITLILAALISVIVGLVVNYIFLLEKEDRSMLKGMVMQKLGKGNVD